MVKGLQAVANLKPSRKPPLALQKQQIIHIFQALFALESRRSIFRLPHRQSFPRRNQ